MTKITAATNTTHVSLPPKVEAPIAHAALTCIALGVLTLLALILTNRLHSFPQDVTHFCHTTTGHIVLGALSVGVAGGAFLIIRIVRTHHGRFWGADSWQPISIKKGQGSMQGYIDTSDPTSLLENNTFRFPVYQYKTASNHAFVNTTVSLTLPFRAVGGVLYQIARCLSTPFFILYKKTCSSEAHRYTYSDIPKRMCDSIGNIARAPFYWISMQMAILYSIINPMHGRKLAYMLEKEWNGGIEMRHSVWFAICLYGSCNEGFWHDLKSKWAEDTAVVIPRCWHPIAYVETDKEHKMIETTPVYYYHLKKRSDKDTYYQNEKVPYLHTL